MRRELVIAFPGEDVEARAPLLPDLAPRTCEAVWAALPVRGQARHAIYSGSEVYLILPELMRLPPENATTRVVPGDVAFGWFAAGSFYGRPRGLQRDLLVLRPRRYAVDARRTDPGEPVRPPRAG